MNVPRDPENPNAGRDDDKPVPPAPLNDSALPSPGDRRSGGNRKPNSGSSTRSTSKPSKGPRSGFASKSKTASKSPSGPRSLGNLIHQVVSTRGYASVMTDAAMLDSIVAALKDQHAEMLCENLRVGRLRAGVLQIFVGDSASLQEMNFHRTAILRRLQKDFPDKVSDVRFRILVAN